MIAPGPTKTSSAMRPDTVVDDAVARLAIPTMMGEVGKDQYADPDRHPLADRDAVRIRRLDHRVEPDPSVLSNLDAATAMQPDAGAVASRRVQRERLQGTIPDARERAALHAGLVFRST